ncbi:hypothetical protein KP77_31950 [Jeotgalibacillus alimentarius]|uniref:Uncharacterized protein n=1 Tax=Jeotgalibacillus alimentarius TaxID=135826 RepID=A0A0C2RP16_9BACL|nr:hypothetical protein KP77_31950 [Jeotgalibacillus alimentarius]
MSTLRYTGLNNSIQLILLVPGEDSCGKTIGKDPGRQWFSA